MWALTRGRFDGGVKGSMIGFHFVYASAYHSRDSSIP